MTDRRAGGVLAGPGAMLFSALIFGFFGFFYINWNTRGLQGQVLLFVVLMEWTLKVSAVLFLLSAGLTIARPFLGNLIYGIVGIVGAVLFVVVAIMDVADKQHTIMAYAPVVLFLFAAWNGYGSWSSLRGVLALRAPGPEVDPDRF